MTVPYILIRQCTVMILYLSLLGLTAHFWYFILPRFSLKQSTQVWISPGSKLSQVLNERGEGIFHWQQEGEIIIHPCRILPSITLT